MTIAWFCSILFIREEGEKIKKRAEVNAWAKFVYVVSGLFECWCMVCVRAHVCVCV